MLNYEKLLNKNSPRTYARHLCFNGGYKFVTDGYFMAWEKDSQDRKGMLVNGDIDQAKVPPMVKAIIEDSSAAKPMSETAFNAMMILAKAIKKTKKPTYIAISGDLVCAYHDSTKCPLADAMCFNSHLLAKLAAINPVSAELRADQIRLHNQDKTTSAIVVAIRLED